MPPTIHNIQPKMTATMAAADTSDTAVALAEHSAALVPFRWHQPGLPPTQNDKSAVSPLFPACHFSGSNAIFAAFAA